ncbi:Active regulator of SIRT1 [Bagarius yarrelli]|uniref:Active regulator of SIRT1 n=1 Tax=Bagarius yarrelli TaxID=175774 RepID=A0A556TTH1_BAGYA|nr:Active regulator of SIRT1 [Bagarius yarrelli]
MSISVLKRGLDLLNDDLKGVAGGQKQKRSTKASANTNKQGVRKQIRRLKAHNKTTVKDKQIRNAIEEYRKKQKKNQMDSNLQYFLRTSYKMPESCTKKEEISKIKPPARPPPPDPLKIRLSLRKHDQTCNLSPETQNIPPYLAVLSDKSSDKDVPPARPPPPVFTRSLVHQNSETEDLNSHTESSTVDIYDKEIPCPNGNHEETDDGLTYDVRPHERGLRNCTTPEICLPPRPVVPPRLSLTLPRKHLLGQSLSAEHAEHIYESIDNVMPQDKSGGRGLSFTLTRKGRYATYHSQTERSQVDGDCTTRELDILLEWWGNVVVLENLTLDCQEEETETKPLISLAQRVKTAMRLYDLLLVQRCTDLLNHITELHCTADSLIKSNKKARVAKLTGGTTGAVGGVTIAAGLALAPLTFGASLVATGVGIGIVAAGGVAGVSASFSKKQKGNRLKDKVEKITESFKAQIDDILTCLRFIHLRMAQLRKQDLAEIKEMGAPLEKIAKVAQEMENIHSVDIISGCFKTLEDMDFYFLEEGDPRTRRIFKTKLAYKVHEVANKLKVTMDQLIRIKNLFLSVDNST